MLTPAISVIVLAARDRGGKLERCKSGYWRVPGGEVYYSNELIRKMESLGLLRYTEIRAYRGQRSARAAELTDGVLGK